MRIYLDESKKIWKGKIVMGWFLTYHSTSFIEKFITNKKKDFSIPYHVELKSTNKYGRLFIDKIKRDNNFEELQIYTFAFCFENYFVDCYKRYWELLKIALWNVLECIEVQNGLKVNIFHDDMNVPNNRDFEKNMNSFLKEKLWIKSEFQIKKSHICFGIQLADLVVWEYRKWYWYDDVLDLEWFVLAKDINTKKT
jgi:hypothetical protein